MPGHCRLVGPHLYGVRCSVSGLTDRLGADALGALSYKRTTTVPCQADAAAQTAFLTDPLAPLLAQAATGQAVAYFAGAAHPTHNPRATHVWTETGKNGPCSPSTAVNGSIATPPSTPAAPPRSTPTRPAVSTPKAPNASIKKLLTAPPAGPVHVICDNARYYQNKVLNAWLADKSMVQVFLPPYSPNLNLIERL